MANRYGTLVGSKKISEDFQTINVGFDRVQAEMDTKGTPADAQLKADAAKQAAIDTAAAALTAHKQRGADEHPTAKGNAAGFMSAADKLIVDGRTSAATPDTLMQRDAAGRAKVTAPVTADDIARKAETDAVQANLDSHAADANIHVTAADHTKLNDIEDGAEVNQNAFAVINGVTASDPSDSIEFVNGTGITVTTDETGKRIMITATGEATPGAHASSHITGGTDVIPNAVTGGSSGLMSGVDAQFVRVEGESKTGAQAKADAALVAANEYTDGKVAEIVIDDASLTQKGIVQLSNATGSDSETEAATPKAVNDARIGIVSDYIRQPGYAVTSGTSTAYAVTLTPVPASLPDGFGITITPHITNGANPTLNVNGLGAIALKDQKGIVYAAGKLIAGKPYTFRKVGSDFLADSSGGSGTAKAGDIRAGKTATNDEGDVSGNLVVRNTSQTNITPTTSAQTLQPGIYDYPIVIGAVAADTAARVSQSQSIPAQSNRLFTFSSQPNLALVTSIFSTNADSTMLLVGPNAGINNTGTVLFTSTNNPNGFSSYMSFGVWDGNGYRIFNPQQSGAAFTVDAYFRR